MRIRTRTLTRVGAALLASALLATGCASDDGDDKESSDGNSGSLSKEEIYTYGVYGPEAEGTPKKGGELRVGEYAELRSLDPTVTFPYGAVGASAMAAIYDVLMRYDFEAQELVPQLAESLEPNDDYTEWTLKLRPDVTFTDGTPLNAEAVIGAQKYYTDNYAFNAGLLLATVESAEAEDDLTVKYTLRTPWVGFGSQFAAGYGMIPAPASYAKGKEKFKAIGAGPFVEESYKPGEVRVLKRNDDYFGEPAHLDSIRFTTPASDPARLEALEAGDFDQIAIRSASTVEEARTEGVAGLMMPTGLGQMYWINTREGRAGNDVRLRQAMAMAIDPEVYLERAQEGAGMPSRNMYSPSSQYFAEVDELETDAEAAKKLVEEAKADGVPTEVTVLAQSDQASKTAAVTVEAMLKGVGFDVKIDYLASVTDQTQRIYGTHDFDLAPAALSVPTDDPFVSLSNALVSDSVQNPSGIADPELDKMIAELQGADGDERRDIALKINEWWQENNPGVAIAPGAFYWAWGDNVHGIVPSGAEQMMLYHDAWLS